MEVIETWTGRTATALAGAMRLTHEAFAERLGVSVRTVAAWSSQPELVPRPEMQHALDTAYERAGDSVRRRFALLARPPQATAQALRVAITVVARGGDVLLVCRRDGDGGLRWQFPAGMVKPGKQPVVIAVDEVHAETGVHCTVTRDLGHRIHPATGVEAHYYLADYLTGEASNRDPAENTDVLWAPVAALAKFIPQQQIYPPILTALEAQ